VENKDTQKKTVTGSAREVQVYISVYWYLLFCFCVFYLFVILVILGVESEAFCFQSVSF
jgi:hypothetical protein